MKKTPSLSSLQKQYERGRRQLSQVGYLSHGSVQDRTNRSGGGAGYQWTRKVARKTITLALTQAQFRAFQKAVANYRRLQRQIQKMEQLSRTIIFQQYPHPSRQKPLSKKVLGTN